jgi:hypothetical protein
MSAQVHPFDRARQLAAACHTIEDFAAVSEAMTSTLRRALLETPEMADGALDYYLILARSIAKRLGCGATVSLPRAAVELLNEVRPADRELLRTARYAVASFLSRAGRPSEAANVLLPIVVECPTTVPTEMKMIWATLLGELLDAERFTELEALACKLKEISMREDELLKTLYALEMLALAREKQGAPVEKIAEPLREELAVLESKGRNYGRPRKNVEDWLERIGASKL